MRPLRSILLPFLLLIAAASTHAQETESFVAGYFCELSSANEIPATPDNSRGLAIIRMDSATNTIHYRLTVRGLTGLTEVRLLASNAYENDRVIATMQGMGSSGGTITGSIPLTVEQGDSLGFGLLSIEVTSAAYPTGHLRGTIIPVPNAIAPTMTPQQEAGHTVTGSSGYGNAILFIDERLKAALYVISWGGLSSTPTMAHFHRGAIGVSGPIVEPLIVVSGKNQITGFWVMDDTLIAAVKRGEIYVNIHTSTNPEGEIRGQVLATDFFTAALDPANEVPSTAGSSIAGGTAYALIFQYPPLGGLLAVRALGTGNTSPWTMAHVHTGQRGVNGPIMQALTSSGPDQWEIPTANGRAVTVDTSLIFRARGAYVNLHSQDFPGGEIRGQLIPASGNLGTSGVRIDRQANSPLLSATVDLTEATLIVRTRSEERGEISLIDMNGRSVRSGAISSGTLHLPLDGVPAGTYIVSLSNSNGITASTTVVIAR